MTEEIPSIYVPQTPTGGGTYERNFLARAASTVGIAVTNSYSEFVIPVSDSSAEAVSKEGTYNFMDYPTYSKLIKRSMHTQLNFDCLPAIIPKNTNDINYFGNSTPLFVKPDITSGKSNLKFAYTRWDNAQALLNALDTEFWELQLLDTFVIQPAIDFPLEELSINISINKTSDIFVFYATSDTSTSTDKRDLLVSITPPIGLVDQLQILVKSLNIRGGLHNIAYIKYNEKYVLLDWNPRPPLGLFEGQIPNGKNILEAALSHMVGIPVPAIIPFYVEQRGYWDKPLPLSEMKKISSLGLVPRVINDTITRVVGYDTNKANVNLKFSQLEKEYNL